MKNIIKFNLKYFILSILIFLIELYIEQTSGFVRYILGDFFAVIFVYSLIKSVFNISVLKAGIIALCIAYGIELLQLSDLQNYYPEEYRKIFGLILGSSFSFEDLVAYTLGIVLTIFIEYRIYLYKIRAQKQ